MLPFQLNGGKFALHYGHQKNAAATPRFEKAAIDPLVFALHQIAHLFDQPSESEHLALTLPTLRKIAALVEGGATVFGNPPEASPSLADDPEAFQALVARLWPGGEEVRIGQGRMLRGSDISAALRRLSVQPDLAFAKAAADADVQWVHRQNGRRIERHTVHLLELS